MNVLETSLPGVLLIEPTVFGDERGFFLETFQADRYRDEAGINLTFVQDNHSRSRQGILRGLHFQKTRPQGKLVRVVRGEVLDVAVNIDPSSPYFGKAATMLLSEENKRQAYIPPGFAHGFQVISEMADFEYKCTDYYDPTDEGAVLWSDPDLGIDWPFPDPQVSAKDAAAKTLRELFPSKF